MKKLSFVVLTTMFLGFLMGFTAQAMAAESSIVVVVDSPPRMMNPHGSDADSNLSVMANFFDGLMQRKGSGGTLAPALALRYEHPDLLTWTFYLRKGVTFHNGNSFNAEDVKFSFESGIYQ